MLSVTRLASAPAPEGDGAAAIFDPREDCEAVPMQGASRVGGAY
jgi:hypothetical protein